MKTKIKSWIKRYGLPTILGYMGSYSSGILFNLAFHNSVITSLAATWGDNVFYYGTIIFRDLRKKKRSQGHISHSIFINTIRNLVIEFGPAEYLDSFFIRPICLYFFPLFFRNVYMGLIVGMIAADLVFYIPTIIAYELRLKFLGE